MYLNQILSKMTDAITTTHTCLSFILIFAQCVGMLPVSGISGDYTALKFQWTSKRTIYTLVVAAVTALNFFGQILKMCRSEELKLGDFVGLIFFGINSLTVVIFIDVARKWPLFIKNWTKVDIELNNICGFPFYLHQKLKIITATLMITGFVEHGLFFAFVIKNSKKGDTLAESLEFFFLSRYGQIFALIPYNIFLGFFIEFVNILNNISWNFIDLFIMLISLCLSVRFNQIVKKISYLSKTTVTEEHVWQNIREIYTKLALLTENVDDALSSVTLLSFGNNVFMIVVQLFFTTQRTPLDSFMDKIYFTYSFVFIIGRFVAVMLYTATIDSESNKIGFYLNTLPHNIYNIEIERFLYQIKYCPINLTGNKLFKMTKSLILKAAGAIVTYELILCNVVLLNRNY